MRGPLIGALLLTACGTAGCAGNGPAPRPETQEQFLSMQLAALGSLPRPAGVHPKTWAQLKDSLADGIEARLAAPGATGSKGALSAPVTEGAQAVLRFDLDTNTFEWHLHNPGDYDQNGEVNISDLTPLAAHFGESVPGGPGGDTTVQAVIDGDGNGLITIADITPLGANLGHRITDFNIYYGASLAALPDSNAAESEVPAFATVAAAAYSGDRTLERVVYKYVGTPLNEDGVYWVRPVDATDGSEGTPSTTLAVPQFLPVARLEATPYAGTAPLTVTLDASASAAGSGLTYRFDPEGDGTFFDAASNAVIVHTYEASASYNATVRIEDTNGFMRSAGVGVNAGGAPRWYRNTLPPPGAPGDRVPSAIGIGVENGRPLAVLNYYLPGGDYYVLSSQTADTPTGNSWGFADTEFSTGNDTTSIQVELVSGRPAYLAASETGAARYARMTTYPEWDDNLTAFNNVQPLDWISFRDVGYPAVAYYDLQLDRLRYVSASNALGTAWETPETPVDVAGYGPHASLAEIAGAAAIAFTGTSALRYVDSSGPGNAPVWNPPVTVASGSIVLRNGLVRLADGRPGVLYHSLADEMVQFRWPSDASGDTWPPGSVADIASVGSAGAELLPTAVMVGDVAHAFWYNPLDDTLMHCSATEPGATAWTTPELVAGGVNGSVAISPADVNGYPAVGYASSSGTFRFAIRY